MRSSFLYKNIVELFIHWFIYWVVKKEIKHFAKKVVHIHNLTRRWQTVIDSNLQILANCDCVQFFNQNVHYFFDDPIYVHNFHNISESNLQ